jgi:hypothetical protein
VAPIMRASAAIALKQKGLSVKRRRYPWSSASEPDGKLLIESIEKAGWDALYMHLLGLGLSFTLQ